LQFLPAWGDLPSDDRHGYGGPPNDLSARGMAAGAVETVNKGVQLSGIADPDGNRITFIGNFRITY
jgi:hypothetical protein